MWDFIVSWFAAINVGDSNVLVLVILGVLILGIFVVWTISDLLESLGRWIKKVFGNETVYALLIPVFVIFGVLIILLILFFVAKAGLD